MRRATVAALAGMAGLAVVGTAIAADHNSHFLKVAMPDGSVARIEYHGDVAPKVTVLPAASMPVTLFQPFGFAAFDAAPFAELDRAMAQMDRQMAAMMQQVSALQPARPLTADGKPDMAAFGKLPAGTVHYSFVSTSTGNGTCSQTVEMTSYGANQQPKVVQTSSGDCGGASNAPKITPVAAEKDPAPAKPALRI